MSSMDRAQGIELTVRERSSRSWRSVIDEDGRVWRIREISFDDSGPSLIFESEAGFRRIRAYPKNWQAMTDSDLYELSWQR